MASTTRQIITHLLAEKGYEVQGVTYHPDKGWHVKTDDGPVTGNTIDDHRAGK